MQLNIEQKKLIQAKPNGHNLIKGVAGSGKTTVAVYRIEFLLNHYSFGDDDHILMVTYNKTLNNYIRFLYEKVEDEEKSGKSSIFGREDGKVDIMTIDSILYSYYNKYRLKNKLDFDFIDNKKKYLLLAESIAELSKVYKNIHVIDQKYIKFLLDEIDWIKSCNYMEMEAYQHADRLGRMNKNNTEGPQKLAKDSEVRKAIFELMMNYTNRMRKNKLIDFKDMALMALAQLKEKPQKKYTHILIDESQDLTRVQLEFLNILNLKKDYSSISLICDTAQSIYPHAWLVKGRSFTSIGLDMTGKSNSLSKNYRTTTQIAEAAYSLIEKDTNIIEDENFVKASLIDKQGLYPIYQFFNSPEEEAEYVAEEIKKKLVLSYHHKDIVIIAKNKNQLSYMQEHLKKHHIPCTLLTKSDGSFDEENVKLLTMHSIKGLEFKVVIIIGLNKNIIPLMSHQDIEDQNVQESNDRKLFYVGMTRANDLLYLTSSGIPSKFIGEINPQYLRLNQCSRIKKYYSVGIDDYQFKEDVADVFSNEEKVRQWMIKELQDNYKYPQKLIHVEYKVNQFSRKGSVDICVSIYKNNHLIPYIFIEVKALYRGLADSLEQLKSYMGCCKTCQYGIVTDGNRFIVINSEMERIEDIPVFNSSMLPTSIENYDYIDLKYNRRCKIMRDSNEQGVIQVKNETENDLYVEESLKGLPMYNSIAAGLPIYMNEVAEEQFHLPAEWFNHDSEVFILRVRGDSMIDADIEDGDHVVIQKQPTAGNRDIVAVSIDEAATLKRFMKMGDTVLLIPENEKYEPIQVSSHQANIIGIAIGIIKRQG